MARFILYCSYVAGTLGAMPSAGALASGGMKLMTSSSTPAVSQPAVTTAVAGESLLATTTGELASSLMSGGNAAGVAMALAGGTGYIAGYCHRLRKLMG